MYVYASVSRCPALLGASVPRGVGARGTTHVYLAILEALFQIVVDGLVRDLANQCEIRHADFLLLGTLEDGLFGELRRRLAPGFGGLLAPGALGLDLVDWVSACCIAAAVGGIVPCCVHSSGIRYVSRVGG
jgi:hypothetical protein